MGFFNSWKAKKTKKNTDGWYQLADFLGIDVENTPKSALSNATYYACLKTLSEAIGKMPLKVLSHPTTGGVREEYNHPLWKVLHDRPNAYMPASFFWSTMEFNRNHYGNAYAMIVGAGRDMQLYPLPSSAVELWYDNAHILRDVDDVYYIYAGNDGKRYILSSDEVLHFRNSATYDGIVGKAVKTVLSETINANIKSQKMINNLYDNGFSGKAAVYYTGDLNDDLVKTFSKGIQNFIDGKYEKNGIKNVIPLPISTKMETLANTRLSENQFLELKQYSALQVAAAFGIKPVQIGDYTKSSYASAESQQLSFLVDTLLYIIKQYEEEITYKLITSDKYYAKFNVDVILRADFRNKVETLSTAVNSFMMTPNEARAKLDLSNREGGDVLVGNGASIPITAVGAQYMPNHEEGGKS